VSVGAVVVVVPRVPEFSSMSPGFEVVVAVVVEVVVVTGVVEVVVVVVAGVVVVVVVAGVVVVVVPRVPEFSSMSPGFEVVVAVVVEVVVVTGVVEVVVVVVAGVVVVVVVAGVVVVVVPRVPEFSSMSPGFEVVVAEVVEVVVVVVVAGVVVVVVVAGVVVVVSGVVVVVVAGVVVVLVVVVVVAATTSSHVPVTYRLIPAASALHLFPYVDPSDPQTGEYSSVQKVQTSTTLHLDPCCPRCSQQASAVLKKNLS